jgi:hypothetical protein
MADITGFERNLESFIFSRSLDSTLIVPNQDLHHGILMPICSLVFMALFRCQRQAASVKSQPDKGKGQLCLEDLKR